MPEGIHFCRSVVPIGAFMKFFAASGGRAVETNSPAIICRGSSAIPVRSSITSIRKSSPGAFPSGKTKFCFLSAGDRAAHRSWTFPAGFMEIGESTEQAAIRETLEEAHADVEITSLYAVLSPATHQPGAHGVFAGQSGSRNSNPAPRVWMFGCSDWTKFLGRSLVSPSSREAPERYVADGSRRVLHAFRQRLSSMKS